MVIGKKLREISEQMRDVASWNNSNLRTLASFYGRHDRPNPASLRDTDAMTAQITTDCRNALATGSVFAGDLQFVLIAIRISHDYERLRTLIRALAKRDIIPSNRGTVQEMGSALEAAADLHAAVIPFLGQDAKLDGRYLDDEAAVEGARFRYNINLANANVKNLLERQEVLVTHGVELVLACRHIERIFNLVEEIVTDTGRRERR